MMGRGTRVVAVVGIDGSGKTSVIRRFIELSPSGQGRVATMTCPKYHETPNVPFHALSRQLDALSRAGDELSSFEIKATAMYLQMTLYGAVQRFLVDSYQPRFILSEHHAVVDTLAYGAFYTRMVQKGVSQKEYEAPLLARLGKQALEDIIRWHEAESERTGERIPFWDIAPRVADLLKEPPGKVIPELERRYRASLPDVVLVLDVTPEMAISRLAARGDVQGEVHENPVFLEQLRRCYQELAGYLIRERPEVQTHVINASASESIDGTLREVMRRSGIA
ncbi:MAG: hypothetical protein HY698_00160 [Deltaproteobacteria bacterium]|nr:hypothetical protein [Deltaproteobacteria bacterium]